MKISQVTLDHKVFNLGFKVVTLENKSLGLRQNPHIIQFPVKEWYTLSADQVVPGVGDFGGIWLARTLGGARGLVRYMHNKHDVPTRIYKTAFEDILYVNSYRVKTNAVFLLEEITQ